MGSNLYYDGHTYFVAPANNWSDASQFAQSMGAHLATISSAEENAALYAFVAPLAATAPVATDGGHAAYLWLGGLLDSASERTWKWVDETAMAGYTNWGSGTWGTEPNNYLGAQDVIAMGLTVWPYPEGGFGLPGTWNDIASTNVINALVEWDLLYGEATDDSLTGTDRGDAIRGNDGNDSIDGGAGIDSAFFGGNRDAFILTRTDDTYTLQDSVGSEGADTLNNVERLRFADTSLALDLDGNAGITAKILGAVFGPESLANKAYVGAGLQLLDGGMSYAEIMQFALDFRLGAGFSDADEVNLLYQNLVGVLPAPADLDYWVDQVSNGNFTQTSLALMAADLSLNADNIGLVGLRQTGLEYSA